jgi:hypothetical protein
LLVVVEGIGFGRSAANPPEGGVHFAPICHRLGRSGLVRDPPLIVGYQDGRAIGRLDREAAGDRRWSRHGQDFDDNRVCARAQHPRDIDPDRGTVRFDDLDGLTIDLDGGRTEIRGEMQERRGGW